MTAAPDITTVTLVTQTRVLPDRAQDFEQWQRRVNEVVSVFDGFIDQASIRPSPPAQLDWVIIHRFKSEVYARAWMQSPQREKLYGEIQDALVGPLDFHLFNDRDPRLPAAPVSAVISTRVKAGQEDAFQDWQRKIAAAEAQFAGYQGYKVEPPIPGVQDEWVMVVRFDSDAHMDAWLDSDVRKKLLDETPSFDEGTTVRKVQSGFESWFTNPAEPDQPKPAAWKMNSIILLVLYPTVFLWGFFVGTPVLTNVFHLPFYWALFFGNMFSVAVTGWILIPKGSELLSWWVFPARDAPRTTVWYGALIVLVGYALSIYIFSRFPAALIH
jgi:uncharacterized protein